LTTVPEVILGGNFDIGRQASTAGSHTSRGSGTCGPGRHDKHLAKALQLKFVSYNANMIEQAIAKLSTKLDEVKKARTEQGNAHAEFPGDADLRRTADLSSFRRPVPEEWAATTEEQLLQIVLEMLILRISDIASRILAFPLEDRMPLGGHLPIRHHKSDATKNIPDLEALMMPGVCEALCDPADRLGTGPLKAATLQMLQDIQDCSRSMNYSLFSHMFWRLSG
jgi:hypothetical protein